MQESDFGNPKEIASGGGSQEFSADPVVSQIVSALNQGDHETAGSRLREALDRSPDDKQLLRLAAKQRRQAERFTRVYSLLKETSEAIEEDEFVRAVGAFREAANLSQGFSDLEQATFKVGVAEAAGFGDRNWRIARALLEDAGRLNPALVIPEKCWADVKAAEREETITNVLEETALAKPEELGRARERLLRTLDQYPQDCGLLNRLKSIESTIEDKRKWEERQRRLKKLTEFRDAMQREEDPAAAGKYVPQSEALASPYNAEPEFNSVLEDIKHQSISAEKALAALKQDRIEDCLEECAWVLSRMRHHQLFLNLKKQAEEREVLLADEYSKSVSRVKELLAAGKLDEAEALCAKASLQLPQFEDLKELKKEIQSRRSKEEAQPTGAADNARRLLELGERSLREHKHRAAELSFASAIKLQPGDKNLRGHLVALLHGYARSEVRTNAQSAEEVLQLTERILPGTVAPGDLVEAIRQKKQQAKDESARWSSLDKIGAWNAKVENAKRREDIAAIREEAVKSNFTSASHADVREAAKTLFGKMDNRVSEFDRRQARRPAVYRSISIAAGLFLVGGLAYWLNSHPVAPLPSAPKTVETAAVVSPKTPVKAASLEIRGAEPRTRIKLDGVLLGDASTGRPITKELAPGEHLIELSRNGFLPKTFTRNFSPGQALVLTGPELQLESSDSRLVREPSFATLAKPVPRAPTQPLPPPTLAARAKPDELQWQAVDKNDPDALRTFVSQYPASPLSSQAKQQIEALLLAREMKAEDHDWNGADRNSRTAVADFLKKYPGGHHAPEATATLADLDRRERTVQMQSDDEAAWKKVNQRDVASLESYLRDSPAGHYRNVAEVDLANLRLGQPSANDSAAVLTVISRLATAWSAKDLNSILAIQRNLSKRAVKAELSQVKDLEMQISPASPPKIDGTQAVVLCRRQASQTFSDGTRKEVPESIVSYVLAKHDGNWTIEGTK